MLILTICYFYIKLSHLDCELLPKLQHIRVAAAKLKNFDISPKLVNVWAYLWAAYNSDIFVRTVPSDQEIGNEIFV